MTGISTMRNTHSVRARTRLAARLAAALTLLANGAVQAQVVPKPLADLPACAAVAPLATPAATSAVAESVLITAELPPLPYPELVELAAVGRAVPGPGSSCGGRVVSSTLVGAGVGAAAALGYFALVCAPAALFGKRLCAGPIPQVAVGLGAVAGLIAGTRSAECRHATEPDL